MIVALSGCEGPAGQNGKSCTVTSNGNGTSTISCEDGTSVVVNDGQNGTSCTVTDNGDGTRTISCPDGTSVVVTNGTNGSSCTVTGNPDGSKTISCADGTSVTIPAEAGARIASFHGKDHLQTIGEFLDGAKLFVQAQITSATADAAGVVTIDFNVKDAGNNPYTTLTTVGANIMKLVPPSGNESASKWVPYLYSKSTVTTAGEWPAPVGTYAWNPTRDRNGTLTNLGGGDYRYVLSQNISAVVVDGNPIAYERNLTHRVTLMMGGHSGPTASAIYDFVPDGVSTGITRNIVQTAACQACHGWEFHGHGGDRVTVESCTSCHVPGAVDPNGARPADSFPGESLDLKVMVHKIHAGGELASIPGLDGIVWDDPATSVDESADNGTYAIWGSRDRRHDWWRAEFPAVIENCTKCHQGTGTEVDNWKTTPSAAACGSCHDNVDFVTGTNHSGGPQVDTSCGLCHAPDGVSVGKSVVVAHDWNQYIEREIPEFDVTLSMSAPANGQYYDVGETPVVSVQLREGGNLLDHSTFAEDDVSEGCSEAGPCPPRDGKFKPASLFVHGPRARRVPVLTTNARAAVLSPTTGPWDLTSATSLVVKLDQGESVVGYDSSGGDFLWPGTITVTVSSGTFADIGNATTDEIVAWLNAHAQLGARAIAYNEAGKVGLRSRNLGKVAAIQLQTSGVTTAVFNDDVTVHMPTGSTVSNTISQRINPALQDPKVAYTADAILYTLDPVDDLEAGTYVASVEIGDRGRVNSSSWKTPSVAKLPFQVKTAAEELPPAGNCGSCHQGPAGTGFVLDYMRHYKIFDNTAVDQCGACHDYQPQYSTGAGWTGAKPISKRVHAVHMGADLNYPLLTVDYQNGDPVKGRNWFIEFPQDIRNCEVCHPAGTTSGTWATKAARLPCMGCHDSDAAVAHMRLQTYDPTPTDPWSGDEQESCQTCH